ncbi:hypothetical protein K1719_011549 [Acacia pycnantha]|nr:hypothetical protein K1719_011549 [Acacia pycnantha]
MSRYIQSRLYEISKLINRLAKLGCFQFGDKQSDANSDYSIFVGDLAVDVIDTMLQKTFASRYSSVKGAKVVIDSDTSRLKGYGFVRFAGFLYSQWRSDSNGGQHGGQGYGAIQHHQA